ncbi:MAG: xanthine dehydrogenase family protein molybdopterin-binding subunit [Anaerolineae bacterium]|nr:xanthine dehydrogenase family protein molybdopterin-binding subunit [Anaerolineae bacterium]
MLETSPLGQPIPRVDAYAKASGAHVYPSDVVLDNMLWVQVLRAAHPHARILSIDTSAAETLPGVVCVLTAKDVPGENRFGLLVHDQPVFCEERVLYMGDAVAVVAAETDDLARQARDLIRVEYEVLPPLTEPLWALQPDAPQLHPQGNLCAELHLGHGDVALGFAEADYIFESSYQTGRQEHAFLETEAGAAYYDEAGILTVCAGGQNPFKDRQQLAVALNLPEDKLRVLHPMMGGAFGGKEDINVQIHLALVTQRTGRPCRLMLDRNESITVGVKRHPFQVRYKTGVKKDGTLTAIEVTILADTGPYITLGPAVIGLAAEHCCGPYYFPHTKIDAQAVFTNNCNASAFRGFGNPQVLVGLEQHMDIMAEAVGLTPIAFRRKNVLQPGQAAGPGQITPASISLPRVLDAVEQGELYARREALKSGVGRWKRRGVGLAAAWQGFGLGAGVPDGATVRIELQADGRYRLHASSPDMGQGNVTAFVQMAAHELNCSAADFEVTIGDSLGPDSGSSNASRTVFVVGSAVIKAALDLRSKILAAAQRLNTSAEPPRFTGRAAEVNGQSIPLAELAVEFGPLVGEGYFHPQQPTPVVVGIPHPAYSYSVQMALVEVDLLTGEIEVLQMENYLDAGYVINPAGAEGQSEGGIAQGLGYALFEDILLSEGRVLNPRLSTYIIPSIRDVPAQINTVLLQEPEPMGPYGARGISEICLSPTAGAILNAIYDAVGVRFERIPVTPEMMLAALAGQTSN